MLSKQDQIKEAAALSEKISMTIVTSIRESVGITKEQANELKAKCYDSIVDLVVNQYRLAAKIKQPPKET